MIYNKQGEWFQLNVGAGLTLKNIVIDSLDSIVDGSKWRAIPDCLSQLKPCCKVDERTN